MMDYVTTTGIRLKINRLSRKVLDEFSVTHPLPQPPTRKVKAWGGEMSEVEDTDNPQYISEMIAYRLMLAREQFTLVMGAIEPVNVNLSTDERMIELVEAGIPNTLESYMRFVGMADDKDLESVIEEIMYQSTVTDRGIEEAWQLFKPTWHGQDILSWRIKLSHGGYTRALEDREAARFALLTWSEFCEMPGQEQSMIVAHYRIQKRLEYLDAQERH